MSDYRPEKIDSILAINEVYESFQGEGRNAGMPCTFLRLAGCNLRCGWCDTPYTWDWRRFDPRVEIHSVTVEGMIQHLTHIRIDRPRNLVITGGEPMLQQRALIELTAALHAEKWHTEIETAGTIKPLSTEIAKQFNVSPKLSHSGNPLNKRVKPDALQALAHSNRAIFKFVVQQAADFQEIDSMVQQFGIHPSLVYIMPEGTDADTLNSRLIELADEIMRRGYNMAQRLHILIYGHQRGT